MAASPFLSKHIPGLATGVSSVLDTLVVPTGLKEVTGVTANLKADGITANEESKVLVNWGGSLNPGEIRLSVVKGGTGDATAGDTAVDVSWMAHGDR